MKRIRLKWLFIGATLAYTLFASCSKDDEVDIAYDKDDYKYVGQAIGNMSADEWYPGGRLGTTDNTSSTCYQDQSPAIDAADLVEAFLKGEYMFEHRFQLNSKTPILTGLGPAYVRSQCIDCHPGYGHGKRVNSYYTKESGNGYLLVIYHPIGGANSNDGPYIMEVTGMPQTNATSPFLAPIDEDAVKIEWKEITAMEV